MPDENVLTPQKERFFEELPDEVFGYTPNLPQKIWRRHIRTGLEENPPWLPQTVRQVYAGIQEASPFGLDPDIDEPDSRSERIARTAGHIGGIGLTVGAIAAIPPVRVVAAGLAKRGVGGQVASASLLGFLYGATQDTGLPFGSKEDLKERSFNAARTGKEFAIFGAAGALANATVVKGLEKTILRRITQDPGKMQVMRRIVNEISLGVGSGFLEPAGNIQERLENIIVGGLAFPAGGAISNQALRKRARNLTGVQKTINQGAESLRGRLKEHVRETIGPEKAPFPEEVPDVDEVIIDFTKN